MNGMKEVHIVTAIAMNPKAPATLYGGTTGGMYGSEDGAMSWKRINNGLIPESELMASMALGVNAIEIDRTNPTIVYAGTTKGLFRTVNKGEQWERIGQSLPDPFISSILLHPRNRHSSMLVGRKGSGKVRIAEDLAGGEPGHDNPEYSRPSHEPEESATTLCRHEREWALSLPMPARRGRRCRSLPRRFRVNNCFLRLLLHAGNGRYRRPCGLRAFSTRLRSSGPSS